MIGSETMKMMQCFEVIGKHFIIMTFISSLRNFWFYVMLMMAGKDIISKRFDDIKRFHLIKINKFFFSVFNLFTGMLLFLLLRVSEYDFICILLNILCWRFILVPVA